MALFSIKNLYKKTVGTVKSLNPSHMSGDAYLFLGTCVTFFYLDIVYLLTILKGL